MSIITWVENGKKQYGIFDSEFFDHIDQDFPVYESHRTRFKSIVAFSEEEVVLVSGDRKRFRRLQPLSNNSKSGRSKRRLSA